MAFFTALKNDRDQLGRARDARKRVSKRHQRATTRKTSLRTPPTRNDAEDESAQVRRTKTQWRGVSGQLLPEINSGLSGISTMEQL